MKKIIMSLVCCLFVHSVVSMEGNDFAVVALDDFVERTKIVSREGLCLLATGLKGKWDNIAQYYDVRPKALAEYVSYPDTQKTGAEIYQKNLQYIDGLYIFDDKTYAEVVENVMDEIWKQKLGTEENILSGMRQRFQEHRNQRLVELDDKIVKMEPDYANKRRDCICCVTGYAISGIVLTGGLTLIGLFSWVIDHCHHPWD